MSKIGLTQKNLIAIQKKNYSDTPTPVWYSTKYYLGVGVTEQLISEIQWGFHMSNHA